MKKIFLCKSAIFFKDFCLLSSPLLQFTEFVLYNHEMCSFDTCFYIGFIIAQDVHTQQFVINFKKFMFTV